MGTLIAALIVLSLLGIIFAALLGLAADYFKIEENPKLAELRSILPGSNCGACGSAGCQDFAAKLLIGKAEVTGCVSGGPSMAEKLAAAMGVNKPEGLRQQVAAVHCGAKEAQRKKKANYSGVKTCRAADLVGDGGLACSYGCLGYADCLAVCLFEAITMVDGLPVIIEANCTACGKCVTACPRAIISLIPSDFKNLVVCSSHDKGAETRKICPVGCIACKICEKELPEVYQIVDNLAVIDYSKKQANCDPAVKKCPTKCLV